MLKQIGCQKFESDCKKASISIENDMPIGAFHDFLLMVKGQMVELMVKNQKDEEAMAKAKMEEKIVAE